MAKGVSILILNNRYAFKNKLICSLYFNCLNDFHIISYCLPPPPFLSLSPLLFWE